MRDEIDTGGPFPECHVLLAFKDCEKVTKGESVFRKVSFEVLEGPRDTYVERFFPWQMQELLTALGFKKNEHGKFEADWANVPNRTIEGDVIHEEDRKDPTRRWPRLKNIVTTNRTKSQEAPSEKDEEIPF